MFCFIKTGFKNGQHHSTRRHHGAKSRRAIERKALERGLSYAANEGARGGEAARKTNCQHLGSSGGAMVTASRLASSEEAFAKSSTGTDESSKNSGGGSVRWCFSVLYWEYSAKQHPVSPQSELCLPWESLSDWQARNSRPGMISNRHCMVIGSQATATRTTKKFLNDRTPDIDAGKTRKVQSNLTSGAICPTTSLSPASFPALRFRTAV